MLGRRNDRGSAVLESIFAVILLMTMALAVVQVALSIYARNVVADSAHQGARAALELGAGVDDAREAARQSVEEVAGGLVQGLHVSAMIRRLGDTAVVRVRVSGSIRPLGPLPLRIRVDEIATATRQERPE